jgi:N-acetylglucosaminyl-diphospho-decaprenol L-rhamnosyltransferase
VNRSARSRSSLRPHSGTAPRLTIVIVNYKSWPDVRRLVSILAATPEVAAGTTEVVLIDNDSREAIPVELLTPRPGVRLVVEAENRGFAAGVNAGRRAARGRWLLVLNPDVIVPDGWLGAVHDRLRQFDEGAADVPGIVGFGLRNPDGSRQPSVGAFPGLFRSLWEQLIPRSRRKYQADWRTRPGPVSWVTGACMLLDARLLDDVGGMDEDFFLYYEEVALCRVARRRGWLVEYDPTIAVTHLCPLQNRPLSPKMRVITRHSKLLYFRKHLPPWQFLWLSWIVSLEAMMQGRWARLTKRTEDARAWRTIAELARAFRARCEVRGVDVRMLAESVTRPSATAETARDARFRPPGAGSARMRRGAARRSFRWPLQSRKDGPACR